jgi:hypothetical protein
MALAEFDNRGGEGIVGFAQRSIPIVDGDSENWYRYVTVNGARIFEYGSPCGTCGIVFRKIASPVNRVRDADAVDLLGTLDVVPPEHALRRLARVLEPGIYRPAAIEGTVRRIEPGTTDDYFSTDVVRLFGLEPPEYASPQQTATPYYSMIPDGVLPRTGRTTGPHRALLTALLMPLHDPARLDRTRIEQWKRLAVEGRQLTAFALSVIDDQQPATEIPDPTYPYAEQLLLTNCLLAGHHRVQAAAELGVPVRVLTFLKKDQSLVEDDADIETALACFARSARP